MIYSFLLQVNTIGDSAAAINTPVTPAAAPPSLTFLELVAKGGPIMIPIGILSLVALYIFIERFLTIKKAQNKDANFLLSIKDYVRNGNMDAAKALCRSNTSPVSKMVEKGLVRLGRPMGEVEKSIEDVGKIEVANLEKNVGILGTIAAIAPMLGFLGTIFGVIKIFYNIALADNISIGLIAGGLYEKMITSSAGLMVGIIAYIFHHIIVIMIERTVNKMEIAAVNFVDIIQEPA
jgi:biopolymer transport protein ExbB